LARILENLGFDVAPTDEDSVDIYLAVNHYPRKISYLKKIYPAKVFVLLMTEPSVTWPWNSEAKCAPHYSMIFSLPSEGQVNYRFFPWPIDDSIVFEPIEFRDWDTRQDLPIVIASNKISLISGELYSLRRLIIHSRVRLALAGAGWDRPRLRTFIKLLGEFLICLKSWAPVRLSGLRGIFSAIPCSVDSLGVVESKIRTSSQYKFAIVIENSMELVTEKIFDALAAGNFPLYVGPAIISSHIPNSLFIQVDPSLDSVIDGLSALRSRCGEHWVLERNKHLSEVLRCHDSRKVFGDIAMKIIEGAKAC
jgi:hypothetical protein